MRQLSRASKEATRLLSAHKHERLPVDVERIAQKYAVVVYESMSEDISGMLIPLKEPVGGRPWAIVVNADQAPVRQRFTLAHELGHLRLHGFTTPHADRGGFRVRFRDERSSDGSIVEEVEANQFAAELLIPRHHLVANLKALGLEYVPENEKKGEELLASLAKKFNVSKQALSIRLSNLMI